jgi:hypothetical protein
MFGDIRALFPIRASFPYLLEFYIRKKLRTLYQRILNYCVDSKF